MSLRSASPALVAALLFGASTPIAKLLVGEMPPLLLAGLLYVGSGLGLGLLLMVRRLRGGGSVATVDALRIPRTDLPWLAGAILFGGVIGPGLLMLGLTRTSAASASLPASARTLWLPPFPRPRPSAGSSPSTSFSYVWCLPCR